MNPCQTFSVFSGNTPRLSSLAPTESNKQSSALVAWTENGEKFAPLEMIHNWGFRARLKGGLPE
jgi:hypothetical protein